MQATEQSLNSPTKKAAIPFLTNILDSMAPKENRNDPFRFQVGVNFKAKIIGIDDVPEARGDRMCQEVIQRQKLAVKAAGQHKQQIIINISLEGIRIIDQASMNAIHQHAVHRISFISRDVSDARAFGYVYGPGDGTHKFFGIKTEKAAESTVLALRDLFQVVFELKKKETEDKKKAEQEGALKEEVKCETLQLKKEEEVTSAPVPAVTSEPAQQPAQQQPPASPEPDLFGLVDLGSLNRNLEEMSFDPMDQPQQAVNPGGQPIHKNPPLGDLGGDSDPFVVNASTTSSGGWGAFSDQTPATNAFANQPFSPTSSSASSDMFGNASPFGGAPATNSTPFGAPAPAPMAGGPFGAPATSAPAGAFGAPAGGGFGAPANNGFGAPANNGFGAPAGGMGGAFGAPMGGAPATSPFGAPMGGGNPMAGGMPAQNGPNANPFLSGGSTMGNGFEALSPEPAPGTEKKEDKPKSVDPFFGDLVGSFSADLGQKKKDEFFKPDKGQAMSAMMPQVSDDVNGFESDPFESAQNDYKSDTHLNFSDSELNSPDQDIPAPNIPPPPLPNPRTNLSSSQDFAPSIPPRPSNTMRQTSSSSVSSQISTHAKFSTNISGTNIDFNFPSDAPPAPPPRPGSRPSAALIGQQSSTESSKGSPLLTRQTTLPSVTSLQQEHTPPVPIRKQFSYALPPEGSTPPPLPTTSPPSLNNTPPVPINQPVAVSALGNSDTPPPPPPRPGMGSMRAPKLGSISRAMTVPEQSSCESSPPPKPRPRPRLNSGQSIDTNNVAFPQTTVIDKSMQSSADPFAVTLPKPKSSRNTDSAIARARPRPRSKTPTQFTTGGFSVKPDSPRSLNNNDDLSKNQNTHSGNGTFSSVKLESQTMHLDENQSTLESPNGSFQISNAHNRTGTPISVHSAQSINSGDHVIDPFENIDPFEKASEDPFSDEDPFKDVDPFSDADPFANDTKLTEFHTKAVSAEGVPLRPDSRNAERRKKGNAAAIDIFSEDPFSMAVDPLQGKRLDKPLIGDGQADMRNSLIDPFDTAFAAATLNTTSVTPQFNHFDTAMQQQNPSDDLFSMQFSKELNINDSPRSISGQTMGIIWPDSQGTTSKSPLSTSVGSEGTNDIQNHDVTNNVQQESDSTSYNSEVSEAFATTPRSQAGQVSTPGLPSNAMAIHGNPTGHSGSNSTSTAVGSGRATPGNPFLPQPSAPIPTQAPQPPPPGATLLDF